MTTPASLSYEAIRNYAERIGAHHDIYDARTGRANIEALLRRLGGSITYDERRGEALRVASPGSFSISLPKMTSSRRDRFTVAHEIGHYFLHYLLPEKREPMNFGRGERNQAETQANVFASSLLMPAEQFRDAYRGYSGDTWALARHFDVSPSAAGVRAQVLGLS